MTYASIALMATSPSLQSRIAACAASCDLGGFPPLAWVQGNILAICAHDGWAAAWEGAPLYNPDGTKTDTGARNDVISDQMILEAVQAVRDAQTGAATAGTAPA